jgi:hypothetical protein
MLRFARPLIPALLLLGASLPGIGQTTGPVVTELALERMLALTTTLTTTELALPAAKAQGILSGAWEVRVRLIYNPSGATLTSTIFVVQPSSVMPTPINANLTGLIIGVYTLNVEKIYSTTMPKNALAFTGTVSGSSIGGVLGNVTGLPFSVSMTYTDPTATVATKVTDVVHLVAGRVMVYTKEASGTLVVPKTTTPTTPPTVGPQIVTVAPTVTIDSQLGLDASGTTDASGTPLSFAWKSVGKTSAILNPNTAMATVQFGEGLGDYTFELTVTNGNGVSMTKTIIISYYGRWLPQFFSNGDGLCDAKADQSFVGDDGRSAAGSKNGSCSRGGSGSGSNGGSLAAAGDGADGGADTGGDGYFSGVALGFILAGAGEGGGLDVDALAIGGVEPGESNADLGHTFYPAGALHSGHAAFDTGAAFSDNEAIDYQGLGEGASPAIAGLAGF